MFVWHEYICNMYVGTCSGIYISLSEYAWSNIQFFCWLKYIFFLKMCDINVFRDIKFTYSLDSPSSINNSAANHSLLHSKL